MFDPQSDMVNDTSDEPACADLPGSSIESSMRPHCQNVANCAAAKPTTHCRSCSIARVNADPELMAKKLANLRARFDDPEYLAAHIARLRVMTETSRQNPDHVEMQRERGRIQYRDTLSKPEMVEHLRSPAVNARRGRSRTETVLGWCPEHLRDEYRGLVKKKGIPAAEARRMIEVEIVGTAEHGKRAVARAAAEMRLKHERELASRY